MQRPMDRPWLRSYPPGVAADIDTSKYSSLVAMFEESFARYRERAVCICMDKTLTYGELDAASRALAGWLQSRGLKRGTRVAVMMPNVLQYPVAVAAILRAGFTAVNVNPLYKPRELEFQLTDAGADAIIVLENFAHVLEQALPQTPVKHVVVASLGDMLGTVKGAVVNLVVRRVKRLVPPYNLPQATKFPDALAAGRAMTFTLAAVGPDDIAFLQYTGGTTGVAKGAMLLHRNLVANLLQVDAWQEPLLKLPPHPSEQIIITALPLYHIFALTACFLLGVHSGATCVLVPNPRDLNGLIKELTKYHATMFPAVNTLYNALLHHPDFAKLDWSMLKAAVAGGMAVQKTVADAWFKATGKPIIEGYGLSETSPVLTCNRGDIAAMDRHHRPAAAVDRDFDPRRGRQGGAARRTRRNLCARTASDAGLLAAAGRDGPRHDRRRLLPHRRHRRHGRARPCHHRRPQEGHDHGLRLQGVSQRGRGRGHAAGRRA